MWNDKKEVKSVTPTWLMSVDITAAKRTQWKDKIEDRAFSKHCKRLQLIETTMLAEAVSYFLTERPHAK